MTEEYKFLCRYCHGGISNDDPGLKENIPIHQSCMKDEADSVRRYNPHDDDEYYEEDSGY